MRSGFTSAAKTALGAYAATNCPIPVYRNSYSVIWRYTGPATLGLNEKPTTGYLKVSPVPWRRSSTTYHGAKYSRAHTSRYGTSATISPKQNACQE